MSAWADFWRIVLYGALGLFTGMSLWVIVFGYRDIKRMFAALREQGGDAEALASAAGERATGKMPAEDGQAEDDPRNA